jgi:hypothetical protein
MVNHKNVQQRWRHDGLLMPQRRRRKRLDSSTEPETDRVSVGQCPRDSETARDEEHRHYQP